MVSSIYNKESGFKFKWKTDLDCSTINQNGEKRGWTKASGEDDWNLYWALPHNAKQRCFNP